MIETGARMCDYNSAKRYLEQIYNLFRVNLGHFIDHTHHVTNYLKNITIPPSLNLVNWRNPDTSRIGESDRFRNNLSGRLKFRNIFRTVWSRLNFCQPEEKGIDIGRIDSDAFFCTNKGSCPCPAKRIEDNGIFWRYVRKYFLNQMNRVCGSQPQPSVTRLPEVCFVCQVVR